MGSKRLSQRQCKGGLDRHAVSKPLAEGEA